MNFAPQQVNRRELLDLGRGSDREAQRSLHDLQRINRYLGGAAVAVNGVLELLQKRGLQRATVLDVGTGLADIPQRLITAGARRDLDINVVALDNTWRHLCIARRNMSTPDKVRFVQADAFKLPLCDGAVDVVLSSLFLHHFRPPQILQLLTEFERVCRLGWLMNDLVRAYVPLVFFKMTSPIFARSYLTRHDGAASIRRGYTVEEMRRIVKPLRHVEVRSHFPYRMSIRGEKVTP